MALISADTGIENEELEKLEDDRTVLPSKFYLLLQEAVNDLYQKVVKENTDLVEGHREGKVLTAVFRVVYEHQQTRTGDAGMLMQWFRSGFRMDPNE